MHFAKNNINCKTLFVLITKRTIKKLKTGTHWSHLRTGGAMLWFDNWTSLVLQLDPVLCYQGSLDWPHTAPCCAQQTLATKEAPKYKPPCTSCSKLITETWATVSNVSLLIVPPDTILEKHVRNGFRVISSWMNTVPTTSMLKSN